MFAGRHAGGLCNFTLKTDRERTEERESGEVSLHPFRAVLNRNIPLHLSKDVGLYVRQDMLKGHSLGFDF